MPEMPDVATLTTISSDWGNDIRDRTVQRYATVAVRTTEHPSPTEGDLSYLEDSNTVWKYDGAAWVNIAAPVNTADIADSAVTSAKIADGTIVAGDLASNAVTTAKILNANVTFEKLDGYQFGQSMATSVTNVGFTTTLAVLHTLTVNRPAGWSQYTIFAEGHVVLHGSGSATDVNLEVEARVGTSAGVSYDKTMFGNTITLPLLASASALTGASTTVDIRGRMQTSPGSGGVTKVHSTINVHLVRTA